jgi:hypothetical protein
MASTFSKVKALDPSLSGMYEPCTGLLCARRVAHAICAPTCVRICFHLGVDAVVDSRPPSSSGRRRYHTLLLITCPRVVK